jgi:hypothetical protein
MDARWLLLIHRIPPKPGYLRVKVSRRLHGVGAIAIKSSVYALPHGDQAHEDLSWIAQEIRKSGGDAAIVEADLVEGLTNADLEGLFNAARDQEYGVLARSAAQVLAPIPAATVLDAHQRSALDADVARLRHRLGLVSKVDWFGAPGRAAAEAAVARIEERLAEPQPGPGPARVDVGRCRGRTWVTRKGVYVDRISSAWLIRRFIDPDAAFRFVDERAYVPDPSELRFDMFEGEFTHEGDLCSFEVLVSRFGLSDPALAAIAELVHDVDLKDSKFNRPETAGFERLVAGIAAAGRNDEDRLARGAAVLDDLYEAFLRAAS